MKQISYTIAVMIYNVERYLPMCLDSIIAQKGNDIEILLIDDGSTDTCGTICDAYAQKDPRVCVIHQKNAGVAAARNVAIDNANGRWLVQVDGDDVLLDRAIEYGRKYLNDDADLLQFDAVEFADEISLERWKSKGEEMVVEGNLLREYHLQLVDRSQVKARFPTYNLNPAWSKMWNMDFIRRNHLHYASEVVKGEGTLFTFTASYCMKKVRVIPEPIYGYRINPFSIMHRFSADVLENQNVQLENYQRVIQNNQEEHDETIKTALLKRGIYLIENAVQLSIAHPDCRWSKEEQFAWVKKLCKLDWVKASADFALKNGNSNKIFQLISEQDSQGLARYCSSTRRKNTVRRKIDSLKIGKHAANLYRNCRYGKDVSI